jgi:hypothetical protein
MALLGDEVAGRRYYDEDGYAHREQRRVSAACGIQFQGPAGYPTRIQIPAPGTPNQGFIGSPEFQGLFAN